jgi:light-harvesting complex I chlorophyll a/b binding protein 1
MMHFELGSEPGAARPWRFWSGRRTAVLLLLAGAATFCLPVTPRMVGAFLPAGTFVPSGRAETAVRAPSAVMAAGKGAIPAGDVGTTRPLGIYDPLNLIGDDPVKYRRYQELEIKHGRIAMAAVVHVLVTLAGFKWSGYASYLSFPPLKFEDIPGGTLGSWETLPQAGWAQIVALVAILDNSVFAQEPGNAPGDVVRDADGNDRIPWVRYDDPEVREFKLNAERNNGRAAMMGIIGMMIHEALTGNPVWPIPVPPQPVLEAITDDVEKGPARVGSFVLASLGMVFCGAIAAIPELSKEE